MHESIPTDLLNAARKVSQSMFCCGTGETTEWGHSWHAPSNGWCVVDGQTLDALNAAYDGLLREDNAMAPQEISPTEPYARRLPTKSLLVVQDLLEHILRKGSGPVAPTFDEFDREAEFKRGKWYVIDEVAFKRFTEFFKQVQEQTS